MDPKKLEARLAEWSRQLGFTLPDGSLPESSLFSLLIATPNTVHLWEKLLNKVEPRDRVEKIRKQILVAKLKSDEKPEGQQDPVLNVNSAGIHRKVELWKKKRALEKMIIERRKEVGQLWVDVCKKAQLIQSESCKLAEVEKNHSDLKEKLLLSNLLVETHKQNIEKYKEEISKIKSYENEKSVDCIDNFQKHKVVEKIQNVETAMIENLEKKSFRTDNDSNEITELISDKISLSNLWDLLLDAKVDNLRKYSSAVDVNDNENEKSEGEESVTSLEEKFMLDITENSLQTILNRKLEKLENLKLKEIISKIENLMFNKSISSASQVDVSYMCPNETGDSLTGRREKMSKFTKALSFHGLKKRSEFLKREIEKLSKENKKNEHWTAEKGKLEDEALHSSAALNSAIEEATELMAVQKLSVQRVLITHSELDRLLTDVRNDLKERKVLEGLTGFLTDIKNGTETELELVSDMCLDVFRRIHASPGKEVYEYESLHHCLDHYGGELREFFSTRLISPYDKPEVIVSKLEERETFLSYVKDMMVKAESDMKNYESRFVESAGERINLEAIEKNHKETIRVLSKVIARMENMEKELELARSILRSWLEQPYRLMIPDSMTVNSMTLRQFEEKYRTAQSEIKYCTDLKQRACHK